MLNLDTRIPLMAQERDYGRGFDMMQKAQENQLRLQALRDEYNSAKEERDRQKAMRSGIQTDIEQIQRGIPAQYSPLQYQQTPQTGQMPYGMTGVLANERGQNMPQPKAFGEDILAGNFNLNREMVAPAQEGRQPTPEEYVQILAKQAMMYGDEKAGFEALKLAAELKKAKQKEAAKWGNNPTKVVNPNTMQPDLMITNDSGEVRYLGASPYEDPKAPKTSLVKTSKGFEVVRDGELPKGTPPVDAPTPEKPMSGYQKIKLEGDLRDDYRKDSSNFVEISRQARIIQDSLKDDSAAGTLASATAFMKMLDPDSVVRESELAMAMKTNGALDRMSNYINVIQSGQVLTAQQKSDFAKLVKSYSEASNEAQRNLNKKYGQISSEYGLDPKRVVVYDVEKVDKPTTINHGDILSELPTTAPKGAVAKNAQTGKPEYIFNGTKWIPVGGSK